MANRNSYHVHILNAEIYAETPEEAADIFRRMLDEGSGGFYVTVTSEEGTLVPAAEIYKADNGCYRPWSDTIFIAPFDEEKEFAGEDDE